MVNNLGNHRLVGEMCQFHLTSVTRACVHFTAATRAMSTSTSTLFKFGNITKDTLGLACS